MILLIDNYDSFTFNLYQLIEELGRTCKVVRNDELTVEGIAALDPERIVISPGPGRPEDAGVCLLAIEAFSRRVPILGVCLGHQAIAHAFGGRVIRAPKPRHGKPSRVRHDRRGVFREIQSPFRAARYHSLVVERESLPASLEVTADTEDGLVMGIRHRDLAVEGVQFHPESVATEGGRRLLANFLAV